MASVETVTPWTQMISIATKTKCVSSRLALVLFLLILIMAIIYRISAWNIPRFSLLGRPQMVSGNLSSGATSSSKGHSRNDTDGSRESPINLGPSTTHTISRSQMNPCQSTVPPQNSQNNFQTYGQANGNQQQSAQCTGCPGNPQGQCTQNPFGQFCQHQEGCCSQPRYPCCTGQPSGNPSNFCQGPCRNSPATGPSQPPPPPLLSYNLPSSPIQTQGTNCGTLPQNIIDQIRSCLAANTAPIFVLPGGCQQQPTVTTQQQPATMPTTPGPLTSPGYQPLPVPTYVSPPSFYPYPIPFPLVEPFNSRCSKDRGKSCGCSTRNNPIESMGLARQCPPYSCFRNLLEEEEEHRCTERTDDAICSKRNCPSAISLQALASQLLSIQGIVSCAATRLILRKIPGSNITTSMEDTIERAQRSLGVLNKDQLLAESRNAQQVNALINLHMTANPPANVVPILTLVQLKVNVLKAQVENLINAKLMENQGFEVETTDSIDPDLLGLKTDGELREFLAVLKEKECEESVNANFAPYRSQRAIAENRLGNLRRKIVQVEGEFERRRRCVGVSSSPPMSARIIREFMGTPCSYSKFGYSDFPSPVISEKTEDRRESPDPFAIALKCPRKLRLKAHVGSPEATYDYSNKSRTNGRTSRYTEKASQSEPSKTTDRTDSSSLENCECCEGGGSSSDETPGETPDEAPDEEKKKLRLKVDAKGYVTVTSVDNHLRDVPLLKLAANVSMRATKFTNLAERRKTVKQSTANERSEMEDLPELPSSDVPPLEEISEEGQRIDDSYSGSLDPLPTAKSFERPANQDERESFAKVPSSFPKDFEVKAERPSEDETIESKMPKPDIGELDDWEFVVNDESYEGKVEEKVPEASSKLNFYQSKSKKAKDTSIRQPTIPETTFESKPSIKLESSERKVEEKVPDGSSKFNFYQSKSKKAKDTSISEPTIPETTFESKPSIKLESSEKKVEKTVPDASSKFNFFKSKSKKANDTSIREPTIPETTFESRSSIKLESSERKVGTNEYDSRYRIDHDPKKDPIEKTSSRSIDAATAPQTEKPLKITTAFLNIENNIVKSEGTEKEEREEVNARLNVPDHKKRFVTTANIMIGLSGNEDNQFKPGSNEEEKKNLKWDPTIRVEEKKVETDTIATLEIGVKEEKNKNKDRIVSMLTDIEYDNPESIFEVFRSAFTRKSCSNNGGDRCCRQEAKVLEEVEEEAEDEDEGKRVESRGNCTVVCALPGNRFPWGIIDNEKYENYVDRSDFCGRIGFESTIRNPQKTLKPNANRFGTATKRIPFIRGDDDTSKCLLETSFDLLSNAFSLIGDRISSFGSVLDKITIFGNTSSNVDASRSTKPTSTNIATKESSKENRRRYLPVSSSSRRSFRMSDKGERSVIERDWLHSLRGRLNHSIIKERDNGKSYVVMLDDSFLELEPLSFRKSNLAQPYEIRRNLLIRSHLKDRKHARKQNLPPPITILKRTRKMNGKLRETSRNLP